jgi:hypothetical protein
MERPPARKETFVEHALEWSKFTQAGIEPAIPGFESK